MSADFSLHKRLLNQVIDEGFAWTHSHGYGWFKTIFLPTLEQAALSNLVANDILAGCYYIAGDIHDVNGAPKKALTYYHSALNFEADNCAIYREIANMLGQLGRFSEALEYSNRALQIDPHDPYALKDRDDYLDHDNIALYDQNDILWNVREILADDAPEKALELVEANNDVIGLQGKSLCYGALEEYDRYLETWTTLIAISDKIAFSPADWFYMPEHIYDSPDIWRTFLSCEIEFSGHGEFYDSLSGNSSYQKFTDNEKLRLSFEYHEHTASKNYVALKQLLKAYPEWIEVREYLSTRG